MQSAAKISMCAFQQIQDVDALARYARLHFKWTKHFPARGSYAKD